MRSFSKGALVTALALTLPCTAVAQVELGVRGGLSIATLGGNDAGSVDTKTGLNVGGFLTVPFGPMLGLQVGAGLAQKGAQETELGIDLDFEVNYLEVPVLLVLSPPMTGGVDFDFMVGPALGFKTGCEASLSQGSTVISVDCDDPEVDAPLKSIDVGAMAGVGLNIGLAPMISLVIDGFYNLGLTKIDDSGIDDDTKNRAFSLLAGLSFSLGG